jgi:hypothetical protein
MFMETQKNKMDDLLKNAMQFGENEIPEPDKRVYKKLRKRVGVGKVYKNPILRFLTFEVKFYQAAIAIAAVAVICLVLRPATAPQNSDDTGLTGADTATAFKGSSLKSDSFLVRNFTSTIY